MKHFWKTLTPKNRALLGAAAIMVVAMVWLGIVKLSESREETNNE